MRCQRIRISCSVLLKAWPMCSEPVTLGGGIMMQYVPVSPFCTCFPALKAPAFFPGRVETRFGFGGVEGFFHRHLIGPVLRVGLIYRRRRPREREQLARTVAQSARSR